MQNASLGARTIGTSLIAAFIGAALVSGKEVWQFFGLYGAYGIIGLALAIGLIATFSYMLLTIARKSGITDMTRVLFEKDRPVLQLLLGVLQAVFMLGVYVVMLSAAGALFKELFPALPCASVIGAAVLGALVTLAAISGVDGLVKIFSLATPFLVGSTALIAVWSLCQNSNTFAIPTPDQNAAPLHNNWLVSALNFVSYNFFCAIGILAPLGLRAKTQKSIPGGSVLGGGLLFTLAGAIYVSLCTVPGVTTTELPMLTLAGQLSPILQYVYGVLLLIGMFAAAVSVTVPLPAFVQNELHIRISHKPMIILLSILAFIGSFCGFGTLIDYLYPVFGYLALIVLALLIHRFIRIHCKKDHR